MIEYDDYLSLEFVYNTHRDTREPMNAIINENNPVK